MDYPNRHRIKIWGEAEFVEDDPALLAKLTDPEYDARPERALVFHIKAWDVNCTQHIRQRYTVEEMEPLYQSMQRRISKLEERLKESSKTRTREQDADTEEACPINS